MRWYQSRRVECPSCGAEVYKSCVDYDGKPMRGVHRARDVEYNRREAKRLDLIDEQEAHSAAT